MALAALLGSAWGVPSCHEEAVEIGRHSNCPSDAWQDSIAHLLKPPAGGDLVMLNIGVGQHAQ